MVLTFIAGFGAVFGAAEGIRASQAKSRREEHRSRKNNLFVHCMKSTQYSHLLEGKQVVLSGHMCFIDTGMAHDTPYGHPFLGYYLPYPEAKYSGLVSTITDEAPIMNWVFVHHETYQLMYGNRQQSEGQLCGPWDCTRQDKRLTFAGWEGFCAVLEDAGYWGVYFDVDGDMLRRRLPGKIVIEIELERREQKTRKPVFEEDMSAEDKLKEAQAEAEALAKVREAQAAAAAEAQERAREQARRQAEAQQKRNSQQQQQQRQPRQARAKSPPKGASSPPATPKTQSEKGKQEQEQQARSEGQPRRRRRSKDKNGGRDGAKSPQSDSGAPGPSSTFRNAKSPSKPKRRPDPLRSPSRAPSQTHSQASSRSHRTSRTGDEGSVSTRASTQRSRGRPQHRQSASRGGGVGGGGGGGGQHAAGMKSPVSNPSVKARMQNRRASMASMKSPVRETEAPKMLGVREELDVSFPRLDELIRSLKYQSPSVEDSDESEDMPPSPDVD
ncbi:hypothetical protein MGG_12712 [Pyricularia oryzae 70-15]|uniref:Uncharacterized protein n=2 Tax=Pyricularia oryzae TaxID=318829 RepID=G4N8U8_PYRO7|nr:uncharacterized protein MGG_12712 [Pyricularia oryzae 70-15]EHA50242.1 hypothetical protein MGG_12712 [Pyricularia oryzae 70-15]ELQ35072.1 hypothetical protein OOU_Y34scaffold00726g31 [Pyricularia oryzae Y34]KAI7921754.1 hypothetical protein M0657_005946 [Pyricularia oryzae]KAI7928763.1 hypothetical protein M9X92_001557 [Pyricularia oryzae]